MKLIALLSWYDEPAWALTELIASLARAGVDHLIAADGAYALYPEGRAQSAGEQAQAIVAACQGAGMGVLVYSPQEVWFGNEVEKRTWLFTAGQAIAEEGDWFWIADGDEVVTESFKVRETLERTEHFAGEVTIEQMFDSQREGIFHLRKLFRYQPTGIHLENNHFTFWTGDGQLLYEGYCTPRPELVDAEPLHFVRVDHRHSRSEIRQLARQQYYDRRKEHGIELVPA
jgi:hypothetical protein